MAIQPDLTLAHYNLGNALRSCGRLDEAIAEYQKALKIEPDDADAHNNLGVVLRSRGRVDEAIAEYRKALEIEPHNASAIITLASPCAAAGGPTRPLPNTGRR